MNRVHSPVSNAVWRWSSDPKTRVDVMFAALVGVVTLVEAAEPSVEYGGVGADTFSNTLIVVASASLLFRRRYPITVLVIVTTVMSILYVRDSGDFLAVLGLAPFYAVAAHSSQRRRAWVALVTVGIALLVVASLSILDAPTGYDLGSAAVMAAFLAGATACGVIVRNRRQTFADSEERAASAEADRQAAAERAAAEERSRIAREMHDVVAHGMSVVSVQAAAAQEIVHTDPDKAAEVLGRIETVSRQSLNEMRRMLGVLRKDDGESPASLEPQPRLADIGAAVEHAVDAGVATELVVTGDVRELPPGTELAGFRVVQEALTNVLKHAGRSASATVSVDYGADDVTIEVVDDGSGAVSALRRSGSGSGLIGMRERVEIYGGSITAGPRAGGGYGVRVVLPSDEAPRSRVASSAARDHAADATG